MNQGGSVCEQVDKHVFSDRPATVGIVLWLGLERRRYIIINYLYILVIYYISSTKISRRYMVMRWFD